MRRIFILLVPVAVFLLLGACDDSDDGGSIPISFDSGPVRVDAGGSADVEATDGAPPSDADVVADADADIVDAGADADADVDAEAEPPKTNLEVWLRADRGIAADGGKVETWRDQSGHGHDFTQPEPARQPALVDADGGAPAALLFTGVEHLVADSTQLFPTEASPLTVAIVFTTSSPSPQKFLFNYGQGGGVHDDSNLELGYATGDQSGGNFGLHRGSGIGTTTAGGVIASDTVYRAVLSLAASGEAPANVTVRINGVDQPTANSSGGFFSGGAYNTASAPMDLGARIDGNFIANTYAAHLSAAGDSHHVGTIAEVLVYKNGLAAGDLPLLETYLTTRVAP